MATAEWFHSKFDNDELAGILSDYHKGVHGNRLELYGVQRCTLVRELETLDAVVSAFTLNDMKARGWKL